MQMNRFDTTQGKGIAQDFAKVPGNQQYFAPITVPPRKIEMACFIAQVAESLRLTPPADHPTVIKLMRKTTWMVEASYAAAVIVAGKNPQTMGAAA